MIGCKSCPTGLINEIRRSLIELDKGMKGQLNMSQPMEDLIKAISINQWPGRNPFSQCRWESKAWPSMKNLISEFADMILRIQQVPLLIHLIVIITFVEMG